MFEVIKGVLSAPDIADTVSTGRLGEDIANRRLEELGFKVAERNFNKPYGEIDIIAEKRGVLHFVEVKTVSCEIHKGFDGVVTYKTPSMFRPEDNVHPKKAERLRRAIQGYMEEGGNEDISHETEWVFAIASVFLDRKRKRSQVFLRKILL